MLASLFGSPSLQNYPPLRFSHKSNLKEENIVYKGDSTAMIGYIVYDEEIHKKWWGLNEYNASQGCPTL